MADTRSYDMTLVYAMYTSLSFYQCIFGVTHYECQMDDPWWDLTDHGIGCIWQVFSSSIPVRYCALGWRNVCLHFSWKWIYFIVIVIFWEHFFIFYWNFCTIHVLFDKILFVLICFRRFEHFSWALISKWGCIGVIVYIGYVILSTAERSHAQLQAWPIFWATEIRNESNKISLKCIYALADSKKLLAMEFIHCFNVNAKGLKLIIFLLKKVQLKGKVSYFCEKIVVFCRTTWWNGKFFAHNLYQ